MTQSDMKKLFLTIFAGSCMLFGVTGCVEEPEPQDGSVSEEQLADAPGVFDSFVKGLTSSLVGSFEFFDGSTYRPWDYGYPSFFLAHDVMGQDIALDSDEDWYSGWYTCSVGLGPHYLICQVPMTYYYGWVNNCNNVIALYKESPSKEKESGVGIAYCLRAMFYMDIAQIYGTLPYAADKNAPTAPIRTDENSAVKHVARATNEEMFSFILEDLDNAEKYLADYEREDVYTPDLSVVYGLKARAYLLMEKAEEAEKYAKLAQQNYTMMSEQEYLSKENGFNTPTSSWMFGLTFKSTDPNITKNDGDSSWGSQMIMEVLSSQMGYAANYGTPKRIDAHLYSTIPATDFRKKMFLDFELDNYDLRDPDEADYVFTALESVSDVPDEIYESIMKTSTGKFGGIQLKFRPKDGEHKDQYKAWTVAVPLMRVEEMKLIEIEAAGMQDEARGEQLLTAFAKTRDPQFVYGKHKRDAYYNNSTGGFRNEVWWQRRVELWGEGFSMYDIKRLQKGIIRSYAGTNHVENYRWNVEKTPQWMVHCFVQTESNYNNKLVQNPTPVYNEPDSPEFVWTAGE